ncbi:ribonuclease T [Sphingomonas koreensis]|nr:ribonuclease T [Sphingomonas koreensis]
MRGSAFFIIAGVASAALPAAANAQAYSCAVPSTIARPRPDLPSARDPKRVLPIGGYTLAIRWAPQYCHGHARDADARFECASGNRFGFTLHGLWPDGVGKVWPQYCRAATLLPKPVIAAHLCANPSVQLTQHEWAKHGTCTSDSPARFLARSRALYARLRYPDMDGLSRRPLTAGGFAAAIARANPGLRADMMRVTADKQGWLEEVWLCLDKGYRYRRCPASQGGLPAGARVKIWRGVR